MDFNLHGNYFYLTRENVIQFFKGKFVFCFDNCWEMRMKGVNPLFDGRRFVSMVE